MKEVIKILKKERKKIENQFEIDSADLKKMAEIDQALQLLQGDVMLRFSSVDADSAKAVVIDYYSLKWLNDNGYYKDGHLNEQYGTAPILTAVKFAERQLNTTDAKLLLNLLEKRVSKM